MRKNLTFWLSAGKGVNHQERGELETLQEVREAGAGAEGGSSKRFKVVMKLSNLLAISR